MTFNSPTLHYHNLLADILHNGEHVYNSRTGKTTRQVLNRTFTYDRLPLIFTKKVAIRSAVAEMLGYLKGYSNAADFRKLGTKTWDANANSPRWQSSNFCRGEDDMGRVYGVQGRSWKIPSIYYDTRTGRTNEVDQLAKIIANLSAGIDDRGEILTFWNPGEFHLGCLRPCMHTHHFTLSDRSSDGGPTLNLTSTQRSADVPLGLPFNMVQTWFLLSFVAQLTGCQVGKVTHHIVNAHVYEDQWPGVHEQISRIGEGMKLEIAAGDFDFGFKVDFGSSEYVAELPLTGKLKIINQITLDDIVFPNVETCGPVSFPFSV